MLQASVIRRYLLCYEACAAFLWSSCGIFIQGLSSLRYNAHCARLFQPESKSWSSFLLELPWKNQSYLRERNQGGLVPSRTIFLQLVECLVDSVQSKKTIEHGIRSCNQLEISCCHVGYKAYIYSIQLSVDQNYVYKLFWYYHQLATNS